MKKIFIMLMLTCSISILFIGCTKTTTPVNITTTPPTSEAGTLEILVSDAPASAPIDHIYVTVANLEAHQQGGSWIAFDTTPPVFDLKSIEGSEQLLTTQTLFAGTYTQIRFDVSSVKIQVGTNTYEATLPGDKIRLVNTVNIISGEITPVIIDFNASESVILKGNGQYSYKPVIHLLVPKPGVLGITTPSLENGEVGLSYRDGMSTELKATGGVKPYTWSVSGGVLPSGLSLNSANGAISGTPTQLGTYTFTIQVKDSSTTPQTDNQSFTIRIVPANGVLIITTSLPNGEVGEPYAATVEAVFGATPYTFVINTGALPDGFEPIVDFPSQGIIDITGTPTKMGDFTFTILVTDSSSPKQTDTQVLTIHIK